MQWKTQENKQIFGSIWAFWAEICVQKANFGTKFFDFYLFGESYSEKDLLNFGVAQGSVLWPDLFKIYIRSFPEQMKTTLFQTFGFADNHQLAKTFLPVL